MIALLVAAAFAALFTLLLTPLFARAFRRLRLGQFIRADTPTTHVVKRGTPSMGGVVFVTGSVLGYFVGKLVSAMVGQTISDLNVTPSASLAMFMMVALGGVGFLDDFIKVRKRNSLGLPGPWKIALTLVISAVFAVIALTVHDSRGLTPLSTHISFVRDLPFDFTAVFGTTLGVILVVLLAAAISVSTTNAVNLTDGLDGLAAGASIFAIGSYIIIGFWQFNQDCATVVRENLDRCYTVSDPLDLATVAAAVVGSLIGFLWWNTSPAQIMMGDTGSFGLGGVLAALAMLSRTELLLILIGGLFIVCTSTVIIQRTYFKLTGGKRIWLASPLHHHFEVKGWAEVTIVVRFWIISGLFVAAGVGLFYLEWLSL
ncbi:phospho-N-acetylmuramoyl-pentapeptide-transferase [Diaminobutyricimonas aerilata]|uniref:Phospho-N-acetylmuramoyl-pentapeptide-transferase n=1 Tax=Diaminobutyricimonas aerilata TaxID=1162967 RepID=A0A2M9CKI4_9MICO|nr:phospho-N-acetylmuramoyl-pentapeptide-transferase [Diaminobutyricimonas aerilata]PJJ72389.1 phospho-N-acetylmuramoyl-pentapeptide-transferase [Diaminobutyricimonas aerilata]